MFASDNGTTIYTYCTDGLFKLAHDLWVAGEHAQAIKYLDKALAIDPMDGTLFFAKALVLVGMQNYTGSI